MKTIAGLVLLAAALGGAAARAQEPAPAARLEGRGYTVK